MNERMKPENNFEGNYLPLGKAIYANNAKRLAELLEKKTVSIDSVGRGGDSGKPTLLMYAVMLESPDMVETLLKHGANPEQDCLLRRRMKTVDHSTGKEILFRKENPLNWATERIKNVSKSKKIAGLLIDHGADINGFGHYYYSPLINALMGHDGTDMVDFLLEKGADINAYGDKMGSTPLRTAPNTGDWNRVGYLLDRGADPKVISFSGWDLMWDVDRVLRKCAKDQIPYFEKLKNRLINEYGMTSPAVQDKEKGDAICDSVYRAKGWERRTK